MYKLLFELCSDRTMNRSTSSRWAEKFKESQKSTEDDSRSEGSARLQKQEIRQLWRP